MNKPMNEEERIVHGICRLLDEHSDKNAVSIAITTLVVTAQERGYGYTQTAAVFHDCWKEIAAAKRKRG